MRLSPERLRAFVAAVFEAQGVKPDHAEIVALRLIDADLRGRTGHGLIRVPQYSVRIQAGGTNLDPDIRILNETPVSAVIDGDNGMGPPIVTMATEMAIAKAKTAGMAWVGTRNSNHAGAAGVYPAMALKYDLIAMYFAVASANGMPPWGGTERLLGTNPIAIAIPAGKMPAFHLDIATTVTSHGTIKVTAQAGEQMPEGWVVDRDGNPITDPNRADEGFLLPIGGYKGSGLNIAIGLLSGVMNGAAFGREVVHHMNEASTPTNTGQAIFVLDPGIFGDLDEFKAEMDRQLETLASSESTTGERIRLPGDRADAVIAENERLGIDVPDPLRKKLGELAAELGVAETLSS